MISTENLRFFTTLPDQITPNRVFFDVSVDSEELISRQKHEMLKEVEIRAWDVLQLR
jgi:hypothetical protein